MWLATQHGFYSIVQKPAGRFHVRTRCELDLKDRLKHGTLPEAKSNPRPVPDVRRTERVGIEEAGWIQ